MKETLVKHRISLLLLVFACLLALAPGANAQDTDCLNLSAEDCAILTAAEANSENVNSFYMNFAFDFTLGGLEALAPEAAGGVEFHLSGKGPLVGNPAADETAMMSGDMSAIFNAFQMQMDGNISLTAPDESMSSPFSFVITDGTLYFQDPETQQWMGMPGETLSALVEQSMGFMGAMGGTGGVDPSTLSDPTAMMGQLPPELLTALSSIDFEALAATPGFLNYQRLADQEMMGQAMSPFQFTADFGALFKSPEFQSALSELSTAALSSTDPDAAQAAQVLMVLPMFLQGTTGTFSVTQWVGATDQFIHQVAIDLEGSVDLSMLAAMSGDTSGGQTAQMPPVTFDLHIEVSFDQINGTFDIVAPEGAEMITPEMMGAGS